MTEYDDLFSYQENSERIREQQEIINSYQSSIKILREQNERLKLWVLGIGALAILFLVL